MEGWLQRWPAASQQRGCGRGGSTPSPDQAESASRELERLGSPHRAPDVKGILWRGGIVEMSPPGLKLSRALLEGVVGAPPQFQGPPQVHPSLRVGIGAN